jgi:WD40 repeat protein
VSLQLLSLATNAQDLSVQTGHSLSIVHLAFSKDQSLLASCGKDNSLVLWDVASGRQVRSFRHGSPVRQAVFHPHNKWLASISSSGDVQIWDIDSGKTIHTIPSNAQAFSALDISKDGKGLAITGKTTLICDTDTWQTSTLPGLQNHEYDQVKFNAASTMLALSYSKSARIWLYDLPNQKLKRKFQLKSNNIAFAEDDNYLVAAGASGKLRRWDLTRNSQLLTRFSIPASKWTDAFLSVSISPDNVYFAGGNRNQHIYIYTIKKGKTHLILKGHIGKIFALAFSPDSKFLASAGEDRTIYFWDMEDGHLVKKISGLSGEITSTDTAPRDNFLVFGDKEGYCKIISLHPEGTLRTVQVQTSSLQKKLGWRALVNNVTYLHNDRALIEIDYLKEKRKAGSLQPKHKQGFALWNAASSELSYIHHKSSGSLLPQQGIAFYHTRKKQLQLLRFDSLQHSPSISRIKLDFKTTDRKKEPALWLSRNGQYAALSDNAHTSVYDLNKGTNIYTFRHQGEPLQVQFCNESQLAFSSSDNHIYVHDFIKSNTIYTISGSIPLYSTGQTLMYVQGTDSVASLDLTTGNALRTFHTSHTGRITTISQLPQHNTYITGSSDGTIKLHAAGSAIELITLVTVGAEDKMFVSPENYYLATKGALQGVGFTIGDKVYSFEQFDLTYNRPDLIMEKLGIADEQLIRSYRQAYKKRLEKLTSPAQSVQTSSVPHLSITGTIPQIIRKNTIAFSVSCIDSLYNLTQVQVTVNGVPVPQSQLPDLSKAPAKSWEGSLHIIPSAGKNTFQVLVRNEKGVSSLERTFTTYYQAPGKKPDLYLVTIGVSAYQQAQYSLKYASKDASDIQTLFLENTRKYEKIHTRQLLNEQVTAANFNIIKDFLSTAGVDDVVVVFMAGHGLLDARLDYYFGSYDIDFADPSTKGIAYGAVEALMNGIQARNKVLFMDTCHSGEFDKSEVEIANNTATEYGDVTFRAVGTDIRGKQPAADEGNVFELSRTLFADLRENAGATIISSAGGAEVAIEGDRWRNGIFTFCLINGIRQRKADLNGDKKIMLSELQKYIGKEVTILTKGIQRPTSRVENLSTDMWIW